MVCTCVVCTCLVCTCVVCVWQAILETSAVRQQSQSPLSRRRTRANLNLAGLGSPCGRVGSSRSTADAGSAAGAGVGDTKGGGAEEGGSAAEAPAAEVTAAEDAADGEAAGGEAQAEAAEGAEAEVAAEASAAEATVEGAEGEAAEASAPEAEAEAEAPAEAAAEPAAELEAELEPEPEPLVAGGAEGAEGEGEEEEEEEVSPAVSPSRAKLVRMASEPPSKQLGSFAEELEDPHNERKVRRCSTDPPTRRAPASPPTAAQGPKQTPTPPPRHPPPPPPLPNPQPHTHPHPISTPTRPQVHLVEEALLILEHQVDQLFAAARRLITAANDSDARTAGAVVVPAAIDEWVKGADPGAEIQTVQAMFKSLQIEAEAKRREEQDREIAALRTPDHSGKPKSRTRYTPVPANRGPGTPMSDRMRLPMPK